MSDNPLPIEFTTSRGTETIYPVVLESDKKKILVDCGYPGFGPLLEQALLAKGTSFSALTDIIITHHDLDHVGALHEIVQQYPHLRIHASSVEREFIEGRQKAPRLIQAEKLFATLPEHMKPGALQFQKTLEAIQPVAVTGALASGTHAFAGIKVIATPGHTPGHISLYLHDSKTLIAGDALVYADGKLGIANPEFTLDLPEAIRSVQKLAELEILTLICFHGGAVTQPAELLRDLLAVFY